MSPASATSRVSFGKTVSEAMDLSFGVPAPELTLALGDLQLSLTSHQSFEAAKSQWLELEAASEISPFQSFEWCRQFWLSGLAGPAKLEILTGTTREGTPALLMPLTTARRGGALVARMLNDGNAAHRAPILSADLADALQTPEARAVLFSAIRKLTGADVLLLEQQPETISGRPHPLLSAAAVDHREEITDAVFTHESWDAFDRAHRTSKSRSRDKRRHNGLSEIGPLSLYAPQTLLERQAFLLEIFDRKSEHLKTRGVHVFENPATRDFLMRIAALDPDTSGTRPDFLGLRVGERWAAAHYGVIHGKTAAGLIIAMGVEEAREHSPGHLLIQNVMQRAFESGATRFSFGLGESDLKTRWADERMRVLSDAVALSPLGHAHVAVMRLFWLAKREIKHRPMLFDAASKVRALLHGLKTRTSG